MPHRNEKPFADQQHRRASIDTLPPRACDAVACGSRGLRQRSEPFASPGLGTEFFRALYTTRPSVRHSCERGLARPGRFV